MAKRLDVARTGKETKIQLHNFLSMSWALEGSYSYV